MNNETGKQTFESLFQSMLEKGEVDRQDAVNYVIDKIKETGKLVRSENCDVAYRFSEDLKPLINCLFADSKEFHVSHICVAFSELYRRIGYWRVDWGKAMKARYIEEIQFLLWRINDPGQERMHSCMRELDWLIPNPKYPKEIYDNFVGLREAIDDYKYCGSYVHAGKVLEQATVCEGVLDDSMKAIVQSIKELVSIANF